MSNLPVISTEGMLARSILGTQGDLIPFLTELDKNEEEAISSADLELLTTIITENAVGIIGGIAGTIGFAGGIGDSIGSSSLFRGDFPNELSTSNALLSFLVKATAPETLCKLIACASMPVFVFIGLAYADAKIEIARSKLNESRIERLNMKVNRIEEELKSVTISLKERQQLEQALIFFFILYSPKSFYRACKRGDIERIKKWLEENPQRASEEYQGKSYLIIAIIEGKIPIIDELLVRKNSLIFKKASSGIDDCQKWTPFVFSIYHDRKEVMEKLLSVDLSVLNECDHYENGYPNSLILESEDIDNSWIEDRKEACVGWTPVLRAAKWKKFEAMKWMIEKDRSLLTKSTLNGDTPLHVSAQAGDLRAVEWLISQDKALVDCKNSKGEKAEDVATSEAVLAFFRELRLTPPPVTYWYDPIIRFLKMLIFWSRW